ncbi:MAG TPA: hypothetical protein VK887_12620 [Pseudonocardiaceae bacterium]|nr:hypothetical protein [Pseudonocardiaceae bacterium]
MDVFQLIQIVVLGPSLIFVGLQVLFQRRQAKNQVFVQGHELYYLLSRQYVDLLRESDEKPVLNDVWVDLDENRRRDLDKAQAASTWGAWSAMTAEEKNCYRYVRAAIEIFEQTFQLHKKGWIDDETWIKWRGWIALGVQMRYFDYVLEDTKPRLVKSFVAELDSIFIGAQPPHRDGEATQSVTSSAAPTDEQRTTCSCGGRCGQSAD